MNWVFAIIFMILIFLIIFLRFPPTGAVGIEEKYKDWRDLDWKKKYVNS